MKPLYLFVACTLFVSAALAGILPRAEENEATMQYGYNPPRQNPDYCVGESYIFITRKTIDC